MLHNLSGRVSDKKLVTLLPLLAMDAVLTMPIPRNGLFLFGTSL